MTIFLNRELVNFLPYPDGSSRIDPKQKLPLKSSDGNVIDFFHLSPDDIQNYMVLWAMIFGSELKSSVNVRYSGWFLKKTKLVEC